MKMMTQYAADTASTARVLTLRGRQSGLWELSDNLGRLGGVFVDMKSAIRFAKMECGEAIVLIDARHGAATTH